jgi:hypothetical protein
MRKITMKGLTLAAAAIVIAATVGQAQAETRFAVQNAAGTEDKMVVTDMGQIGLGITNPLYPLHIKANGPTSATTIEFHNQGNTTYSAYDSPAFQLMRNNSVTATGGNGVNVPRNGDRLGNFAFGSYLSGAAKYSAFIAAFADGTWTNTSYPGYLSLQTAGATAVYPTEKMRITPVGNVGIGVSAPTQRLQVNGGIRLNTTAAKPTTCNATTRGTLWFTQNATGADTMEVCSKDASGNYDWRTLL